MKTTFPVRSGRAPAQGLVEVDAENPFIMMSQ